MKANNDDIKCHLQKNFQLCALWLCNGLPDGHTAVVVCVHTASFFLSLVTRLNVRRQLLALLGQNIAPYSG